MHWYLKNMMIEFVFLHEKVFDKEWEENEEEDKIQHGSSDEYDKFV